MSQPRYSLTMQINTLTGKVVKHDFQVNDVALGRVNNVWREVKVMGFEQTTIDGNVLDGIKASWEVPGSTTTMRKVFVPMAYSDLVPNTPEYRDNIKQSGASITASKLPEDFANFTKVKI
ncbi:hypothetical protein BC835DRAFT_1304473 [Cytidiella melzeri]|nr:hypothetical protein BC835DRAFT_1304473 [Cytidiella melzeri]